MRCCRISEQEAAMHSRSKLSSSKLSSSVAGGPTPTEERYRSLLRRRRSGQSLRAFAEEVDVPVGTLAWWQHELRKRDRVRANPDTPMFLPVRVSEPLPTRTDVEQTVAAKQEHYDVVLGRGRVIRVAPGFDAATVTALVRAVEAASC
jgi:hypothetical protein